MGPGPARAADLSAYVKSLIRFKAQQLCRRPSFSRSDEEDIAHDLTLALLAKRGQYDPDRGASADTFADRIIHSQVKMILRSRRQQKRAAGFRAQSLQSDGGVNGGAAIPLVDQLDPAACQRPGVARPANPIADLETREAIKKALATLDPATVALVRQLEDQSVLAVSKATGISRRQIRAAVASVRQRFEEAGLEEP